MSDLHIAMVQSELAWEEPSANREHFERALEDLPREVDLVLLPEMFSTGFSMNAEVLAEPVGGETEAWLQALAAEQDAAITGSLPVRDGNAIYNRLLFATPDGHCRHYDKHHLFTMSTENDHYSAGNARLVVEWRGWRICPMVCYDLRFPVFSRNREDYDLAVYVANWPAVRREHWRQLLVARAIENLACVVGVNRVGSDARGLDYSGDSLAIAADGNLIRDMENENGAARVILSGAALRSYREGFPCQLDADSFQLE
jgi:predicted amidohydrolase